MASSLTRFLDHTHTPTHHSRYDSSGRVISSSQRPLPDNTQNSQQTDIHGPRGIRTHDPGRRTAADLRLKTARPSLLYIILTNSSLLNDAAARKYSSKSVQSHEITRVQQTYKLMRCVYLWCVASRLQSCPQIMTPNKDIILLSSEIIPSTVGTGCTFRVPPVIPSRYRHHNPKTNSQKLLITFALLAFWYYFGVLGQRLGSVPEPRKFQSLIML